ncbi:secondary thiamine-phosphate synthase enzyme YjbQ [Dehalococcoidia bacterium]|nr:secondary thiamine-phosphate synthase enzyme YjbQ [Dehalococcoidia bacterium]MCL0056563.1 secondary thiamine-phosphate synthase enzyme YjbQ [Dehalococcoidia bacterium]MCL0065211.1 secondary thiamine-phosphate synthase enzyme YjbQ [Dehalococcoidia bacterium]MCL0070598.1 secondary thiamine-phosphate synthase enzyme YjbQ [Dehalococcoidia bacterium]MCL0081695.1 secondary thiamine-phosphate synthase enzyme YjbQ [Dehalococcoidia bacterium]
MVTSERIRVQTGGNCEIVDITDQVSHAVKESGLRAGTVTVFVSGSTAGVTTVEYEPGLIADLQTAFERLFPQGLDYQHNNRWGDGNGHSHVRASLLGSSMMVPFAEGRPMLGTWQQVVLIDFDNRPRTREVILQIMGE